MNTSTVGKTSMYLHLDIELKRCMLKEGLYTPTLITYFP